MVGVVVGAIDVETEVAISLVVSLVVIKVVSAMLVVSLLVTVVETVAADVDVWVVVGWAVVVGGGTNIPICAVGVRLTSPVLIMSSNLLKTSTILKSFLGCRVTWPENISTPTIRKASLWYILR